MRAVWTVSLPGTLTAPGTLSQGCAAFCLALPRECWSWMGADDYPHGFLYTVSATIPSRQGASTHSLPGSTPLHPVLEGGLCRAALKVFLLPSPGGPSPSSLYPPSPFCSHFCLLAFLLRSAWKQDMEQGNPEWACARGPTARSPRRQSPPQLSEYGLGEVPRMDCD